MFRDSTNGIAPRTFIPRRRAWSRAGAILFVLALSVGASVRDSAPALARTSGAYQTTGSPVRRLVVARNKSRTLQLDAAFASAVVGAPDIVDVLPMADNVIYIQGKKIGTTNITLFDHDRNLIEVLDVEITIDIKDIAEKIHAGTESAGIRVAARNEQIILSGEARNAVDAERAVAIAKAMAAPEGKDSDKKDTDKYVINAMRIAPSQQVMLRVRFVEVTREAERDIGVNWFGANRNGTRGFNTGRATGGGVLDPVTQANRFIQGTTTPTPGAVSPTSTTTGIPLFQTLGTFAGNTLKSPFGVGLFNLGSSGGSVDILITALEDKGLARRLAEPDLVALSGDTASFLAGGEYPVPSVQSSSGTAPVITTEYKPFGVQLTFVPTVLANGIINLRLTPSVSELDYANGVEIAGTRIPGLSKREARTVIELRDGQSFAIAGLLQSNNLRDIAQIPWLGSVPVLGALFRSSSYQQNETDLVVIVTPHLVAPAAPGQALATPFDRTLPGNDVDLFLMGREEVRKRYTDYVTTGGKLQGPYGHIMPLEPK